MVASQTMPSCGRWSQTLSDRVVGLTCTHLCASTTAECVARHPDIARISAHAAHFHHPKTNRSHDGTIGIRGSHCFPENSAARSGLTQIHVVSVCARFDLADPGLSDCRETGPLSDLHAE